MTGDVTINNALDYSKTTSNSSAQLAEDFDDFLILLTTQLQNQDPLAPMDSTEFTSQLVAFAGIEQQINQNQKLDSLVALNVGGAFSSALNYVGMNVSYLSSETHFDGETDVEIDYAINGESTDTTLNILDSDGSLIFSKQISNNPNGESFVWDGTMDGGGIAPAGTYEIRVDALDAQNNALNTTTVVTGRVNGIETQNGSTLLLIGERAVSLGSIINVSEPKTTTTQQNNNA